MQELRCSKAHTVLLLRREHTTLYSKSAALSFDTSKTWALPGDVTGKTGLSLWGLPRLKDRDLGPFRARNVDLGFIAPQSFLGFLRNA